jgi:hypothetical protein
LTRAGKLLERLNGVYEQEEMEEPEEVENDDEDEMEDEEEDPNPFSKENRNPDGSIKTKGKDPINDKKKKK